jgi:hypothetical protein
MRCDDFHGVCLREHGVLGSELIEKRQQIPRAATCFC